MAIDFLNSGKCIRGPMIGQSRPADARQKPTHHPLVWITSAALKFILLHGLLGKGRSLLCRLSLGKCRPLTNFRRVS
jgi:hypothetical protein